jgi:Ser/Thr protein kinase RdoA (MazF antagonist)
VSGSHGGPGSCPWRVEEVRGLLAGYGRRPRALEVAELAGGVENLNLRLDADGELLVLRRYDATAPAEVPWEIELLRRLVARGFPTAPLIARSDGALASTFSGRPAALFAYLPGRHPAPDDPRGRPGRRRGRPAARADRRADAAVPAHEDGRSTAAGPVPDLARGARRPPGRGGAGAAGGGGRGVHGRAGRPPRAAGALPRGAIHHDAHADNLLLDEAGRLVALLDFDDAHETFLLGDLAVLLEAWGVDRATNALAPERTGVVLRAYRARRRLSEAEQELLPDFLALYSLADSVQYVADRVEGGAPAERAAADCNQYARFRAWTARPGWRDRLRASLTGAE